MSGGQFSCPIVFRGPTASAGQLGATHSQAFESWFANCPGLKVVVPSNPADAKGLLKSAIREENPVVFIEHKLLYASKLQVANSGDLIDAKVYISGNKYPTYIINFSSKPKVTIATYGYNFEIVREAAIEVLYENEIYTEIILFSQISPVNIDPLLDSIKGTRKLITFEEGYLASGWGSEIAGQISEADSKDFKLVRIGAKDFPIPNSNALEELVLPSKQILKEKIIEISMR